MKPIIFSILTLVLFLYSGCEKQNETISREPIKLTTEQKQIVSSSNSFGFNLFKQEVNTAQDGANVFVSPLSVSLALSMLYNGTGTTTKDELAQGLGFAGLTDEQVNVANRDLIQALLQADPKVIMEIANSIWHKNTFGVEPGFLSVNKEFLNADVRSAAFDNSTKNEINSWVSGKTHEKITSIVDEIPADAVMYLINAIYFKGVWQYRFDSSKTRKMDFIPENGIKKQTDFMVQEGSFEYVQNDLFSAVNLPYGDGNFSMMVLVPNTGRSYKDITEAMNDQNWTTWNNNLKKVDKIRIYLPKFKFSYKKLLNEDLQKMGMKMMFSDFADLTGINRNGQIKVSKVLHKTFVEVNEEGTEAAAVTSVEIVLTTANPDLSVFRADRPFIFVIREKQSNALLFMGVMNDPVIEN